MTQSLRGWPNRAGPNTLERGPAQRPRIDPLEKFYKDHTRKHRTPWMPNRGANTLPRSNGVPTPLPALKLPKGIRSLPLGRSLGRIGRIVGKLHPGIRLITTAIDLIEWFARMNGTVPNGWTVPGYTLQTTCSGGEGINWWASGGAVGSCLVLQAGGQPLYVPMAEPYSTVTLAKRYETTPGTFRWDSRKIYTRNADAPAPSIEVERLPVQRVVNVMTLEIPGLQYFQDFILPNTFINPQPVPYAIASKLPYDPDWKYQGRQKEPKKLRKGRISLLPYLQPSSNTELVLREMANGQTRFDVIKRPASVHVLAKPGPNVRESKLSGKTGVFYRAVSKYGMEPTEWLDFLDSFYQALPEDIQSRYHGSVSERVRGIFEHWDKLDWDQVTENLLLNELEDRASMRINKFIEKKGVDALGAEEYFELRNRLRNILEFPHE